MNIQDLERLKKEGKIRDYSVSSKKEPTEKRSKYGSKRVQVDGIWFDSKKEASRYFELKVLEMAGEITDLELQVEYQLPSCKYFADFRYKRNGETIVEDTKSSVTKKLPVYRLKKKLMLEVHGIEIKEV